jgi:hypothetical protein
MNTIQLFADVLNRNLEMLKATIADFSDADMLVRPVPSANHAAWQLGHLTASENNMLKAVNPGITPPAPASFAEKFTRQTATIDDPKFFPKKAELIDVISNTRMASIAWVKTLTLADLETATPEKLRNWVPTIGHLVTMMPSHAMMHVGQFQVIRRKLGKPILF